MRALLISAAIFAACSPTVDAQDRQSDGLNKIAERDLREFKAMLPGVYDNQEQVYFQENLDLPQDKRLPRLTLTITPDGNGFKAVTDSPTTGRTTEARLEYFIKEGQIQSRETREGQADCDRIFTRNLEHFRGEGCGGAVIASDTGFVFGDPDRPFKMRRAQMFKCWVSPQKTDGSYAFYNDVVLHDQGGRAWVTGDDHPRVGLKIRNVVWAAGNNRPSLVLYTYKGDDEDKAASYAWTSPDEPRIGINLRWMQVSCTRGSDTITPGINLKTGSGQ